MSAVTFAREQHGAGGRRTDPDLYTSEQNATFTASTYTQVCRLSTRGRPRRMTKKRPTRLRQRGLRFRSTYVSYVRRGLPATADGTKGIFSCSCRPRKPFLSTPPKTKKNNNKRLAALPRITTHHFFAHRGPWQNKYATTVIHPMHASALATCSTGSKATHPTRRTHMPHRGIGPNHSEPHTHLRYLLHRKLGGKAALLSTRHETTGRQAGKSVHYLFLFAAACCTCSLKLPAGMTYIHGRQGGAKDTARVGG